MSSIRSKIDATEKHVPAWKKLGLKLKYAKDEPEPEENGNQSTVQNEKKRKLVSDETTSSNEISSKKLKAKSSKDFTSIENTPMTTSPHREFSHLEQSSHLKQSSLSPTTPTGPRIKRKSVTFTPETKTEDGDSIKQLYNTWLASHRAVDPAFDPSAANNSEALKVVVPPSITLPSSPSAVPEPPPKAKKKKSKSKSTLLNKQAESQPQQTTTQASPTLAAKDDQIRTYITTHHLSPSIWKFSKSRQKALLRSLFSFSAIPSSYDSALLSYLRGLQGAAVKSRVRKMALQVRGEDEEWLKGLEPSEKDKATRRADYEGAVKRIRETLKRKEELREEQLADEKCEARFWKRRRAEVVLWGIGEVEDNISHPPSMAKNTEKAEDTGEGTGGTANANPPTRKLGRNGKPMRKRKVKIRKSGVPDDDETSSSSSSSSSFSSSSSSDDGRTGVGGGGRVPKRAIWDEDTSSEDSSSSSEDSSKDGGASAKSSGHGISAGGSGAASQSKGESDDESDQV